MIRSVIAITLLSLAGLARAAAPVASLNVPFTPYAGPGPVGNDGVESNEMQWLAESTGTYMSTPVQSWLLVWDPVGVKLVSGSIRFDAPIVAVFGSRADLLSSSAFERVGIGYDYSKLFVGLETDDAAATSFAGDTLSLSWLGANPGDHVRVLTAVPEPGTWATFAAGLVGIGWLLRRRRT
ncbi:MAG: hypothetical protein Fur0014_18710 [Rubrivivax sp.]